MTARELHDLHEDERIRYLALRKHEQKVRADEQARARRRHLVVLPISRIDYDPDNEGCVF